MKRTSDDGASIKKTGAALGKKIQKSVPAVAGKFKQAGELVQNSVRKVIPQRHDEPETRYFKLLGLTFVGLILIAVLAALATFLLTLRSPEAVTIPNVIGNDLPSAMETLQDLGLVSRIEQRFFPDPATKGLVMEQDPIAGSSARVGREVMLIYSKGAVLDEIGSYIGRNVDEVRYELGSLFSGDNPLLGIGTVSYAFDESDAGTIISQDPSAGTKLSQAVRLKLLVSRGRDESLKNVPELIGVAYQRAIEQLINADVPFGVQLVPPGPDAMPGTVSSQEPAGNTLLPATNIVMLSIVPPEGISARLEFGVYSHQLPDYAVPVEVIVYAVNASGAQTNLYRFKHPGGPLSVPYIVEDGSEIVLTVFGREINRITVGN